MQQHSWKAPLPPPSVLAEFNEVVPNGAERIVQAWETESAHRRSVDKREQLLYYSNAFIGKLFAFLFVLAALGVSAYSASIGAEWLGVILGAGTIGSVVWAFIHGRKPKS